MPKTFDRSKQPVWMLDLTDDQIACIRDTVFNGIPYYMYARGERQVTTDKALAVARLRRSFDKPAGLHWIRPDVWGPEDKGPEV